MSEPKERAKQLSRIAPDLVQWTVRQSRIGGARGDSYAVLSREGVVLIDPLPLEKAALERLEGLGQVIAIALTIQSHQRSSWRYARRFGVEVWAPHGAQGLDERPQRFYDPGDRLPGGLTAIGLPGPAFSGCGFKWRGAAGHVLFCGDLFMRTGRGLAFVPDEYMDSPDLARRSARKVRDMSIDLLCLGHGAPLIGRVKRDIAALLARDRA